MPFLAENLGIITPDITRAMKKYDLPGMLVLLFAFDESMPRNPYILHNHEPRNIVYTGTHDNKLYGMVTMKGLPRKERVSRNEHTFYREIAATVPDQNGPYFSGRTSRNTSSGLSQHWNEGGSQPSH